MKKTILLMAGIGLSFLTTTALAQNTWEAKKNPTVDSITSQYASKYVAPRPALTTNDIFPVIGSYTSTTNPEIASVTIELDGTNKGVVWITGLPQGKIKAMLRKSPGIYKIPEQKTDEGKEVKEGTLIFDKETNALQIAIGKSYNAEDPAAVFAVAEGKEEATVKVSAKSKTKKPATPKLWLYNGTKVVVETAVN